MVNPAASSQLAGSPQWIGGSRIISSAGGSTIVNSRTIRRLVKLLEVNRFLGSRTNGKTFYAIRNRTFPGGFTVLFLPTPLSTEDLIVNVDIAHRAAVFVATLRSNRLHQVK